MEGEASAAEFGLQRYRIFVMGSPNLVLAVDYEPLTKIFDDRPLETIPNPRVLQLKEKTLMYRYDICYMPGNLKTMKIPDINSQNPIQSDNPDSDHSSICEVATVAYAIHRVGDITTITWETVNKEAATNQECIDLVNRIRRSSTVP